MSRSPTVGLAVLGLLAVGISGCHGFEPTVRRGMSVDARCPEDKIEVVRRLQAEGAVVAMVGLLVCPSASTPTSATEATRPLASRSFLMTSLPL